MATKQKALSRKEQTAAEIDTRIHDLVIGLLNSNEMSTSETIGYLRAAYAQGYTDCLKEPEGQRGRWIKGLGYGVKGVEL